MFGFVLNCCVKNVEKRKYNYEAMVKRNVKLGDMKDINAFNKLCSHFGCDMDLVCGKYYVDAKSIMGGRLDLERPLELVTDTDDAKKIDEVFKAYIQ